MISELLNQIDPPFTGESLFDHLVDIVYFIKNIRGEYLVINQTLVGRCGLKSKAALIGRTATELWQGPLGRSFREQDLTVIRTGVPLLSQLELHLYPPGNVGWCLTTKLPLRDQRRKIIGLVGVSQDLRLPDSATKEYQHLAETIHLVEKNLEAIRTVPEFAKRAKLSRYQLDRRMQRLFGLTSGQWLMKARIDQASRLLQTTDESIAAIAFSVGYSDQSAFSRQFRRTTGLTPGEYRLSSKSQHG
ncbi:Virulence regulon transcriptional activator VirF [Planctomycetales bacterium 10988]|nr:Virulence regulon transcriptional activator VirF [Planctomycetales bacterium 10988]